MRRWDARMPTFTQQTGSRRAGRRAGAVGGRAAGAASRRRAARRCVSAVRALQLAGSEVRLGRAAAGQKATRHTRWPPAGYAARQPRAGRAGGLEGGGRRPLAAWCLTSAGLAASLGAVAGPNADVGKVLDAHSGGHSPRHDGPLLAACRLRGCGGRGWEEGRGHRLGLRGLGPLNGCQR
jgi:hypothetical protein